MAPFIARSAPGNNAPLAGGGFGSIISGPALYKPCLAILFHATATGNLVARTAFGEIVTIDVANRAKGVWHLESFSQFIFLGSTVSVNDVEIGWSL